MAQPNLKVVEDAFHYEVANCLGNSKRKFASGVADLFNHAHKDKGMKIETIAAIAELHKTTVIRVMEHGGEDGYTPSSRTIENGFRAFNMTATFHYEVVKPRFRNKPRNPE